MQNHTTIKLTAILQLADHHCQWVLLQLYGSSSRFRSSFSLDDATLFHRFYTQTGKAHFNIAWLESRYLLQNAMENKSLDGLYNTHDRTTLAPSALEAVVETVANATGKKLHGVPLLADEAILGSVQVLTAPPSMHNVMFVAKNVMDVMLKFAVPENAPERTSFCRLIEGAVGINAHGQCSASVATYRKLIAQ